MSTIASRIVAAGRRSSMPTQPRKSAAPAPNPRLKRPPESSSSVAASIASSAGWIVCGLRIPAPTSIRVVAWITAVSRTGAERRNRSLLIQI
jgi:hypothetical protein